MDAKNIRVLVIDDSESIQFSLHQVLIAFPDLEWVGESRRGEDALELCEQLHPDVVLLDVGLPHVDVAQITHLIRERFPLTQVIGIAGFEEQTIIKQVLGAGAIRCVSKDADITRIADAVRQVVILTNSGS
jgi:DNA-binding NarL/FixJ family response regulator